MEEQKEPNQSVFRRLGRVVARELRGVLKTGWEKIPLEQIDEASIARTIYWQLGNPLLERLGKDKWANPFTIVDVLANMGHVGTWVGTDYYQKFPEEYQRTRVVIQKLVDQGALETLETPPDLNKETLSYKVKDENILKNLVDEAKVKTKK